MISLNSSTRGKVLWCRYLYWPCKTANIAKIEKVSSINILMKLYVSGMVIGQRYYFEFFRWKQVQLVWMVSKKLVLKSYPNSRLFCTEFIYITSLPELICPYTCGNWWMTWTLSIACLCIDVMRLRCLCVSKRGRGHTKYLLQNNVWNNYRWMVSTNSICMKLKNIKI